MAMGEEWTEWHLTPRGWECGSEQNDFGHRTERDTPTDRVMTCKYKTWLGRGFGKRESVSTLWTSPDEAQREALLQQYGECPNSL